MQQRHRIFIAINLPKEVRRALANYEQKWADLPAKWSRPENLHITLAFLGNTSDQELTEVCGLMQQVGERHTPFAISINHIVYGPDAKRPRMIWAVEERTPQLLALQKDVVDTLGRSEDKPFSPHLTLARLKAFELQRMETEELSEVNEEISLSFKVSSLEVMESALKRSGAEYTVVQSCKLGA